MGAPRSPCEPSGARRAKTTRHFENTFEFAHKQSTIEVHHMPEIVRYIPEETFRQRAKEIIFDQERTREELTGILFNYLTEDNLFSTDKTGRFSHWDIYYFCIYSGIFPQELRIGNSMHPGPGVNMQPEQYWALEDFFIAHRHEIIPKILLEITG